MKKLVIFLSIILPLALSEQWIDPHDMNPKPRRNLKKSSSTGDLENFTDIPTRAYNNVEENNTLIYMKRFVNLILNSAVLDKDDPSMYRSKLSFSLDDSNVQFLRDFSGSEKVSLDQLRKLDAILSDIFRKRYLDDISDMLTLSQDNLLNVLRQNGLQLGALCLFLYISYNLFRSNFSLWYIFRYFVFIIIVVDYIQRYQQLSEEAEEHNMHLKYSTKCDTVKMSWGEYFKFLTGHEDCEKKVVSVLEVALFQVKSIILIPLTATGAGMGHFATELWDKLPFPWNIIIFPSMLVFCLFLVVIVMTTINGTPFKVNLMHLFHIEFGEKTYIGNATVHKLIDMVGRPLILDVKERRQERSPPKQKNTSGAIKGKASSQEKDNSNKHKDKSKHKSSNPTNSSKSESTKVKEAPESPKKEKETVNANVSV